MCIAPLQAVLFDMDGTLVRTFIDFPALRQAVADRAMERYGVTEAVAGNSDSLDIIAQTLMSLTPERRDSARADLYGVLVAFEERGCQHPQPVDGATELLNALKGRGVATAIVTRNTRRIAVDLCARMGLVTDILVAREDTTTYKPHPDPLLVACRAVAADPGASAMVGDLWTDIAAGKAAGCPLTIGIQWPHDPPNRFAHSTPTHIVASLKDAAALLIAAL